MTVTKEKLRPTLASTLILITLGGGADQDSFVGVWLVVIEAKCRTPSVLNPLETAIALTTSAKNGFLSNTHL